MLRRGGTPDGEEEDLDEEEAEGADSADDLDDAVLPEAGPADRVLDESRRSEGWDAMLTSWWSIGAADSICIPRRPQARTARPLLPSYYL